MVIISSGPSRNNIVTISPSRGDNKNESWGNSELKWCDLSIKCQMRPVFQSMGYNPFVGNEIKRIRVNVLLMQ